MMYQFDSDCALDVGVEESIILSNIMFWIAKNEANNKHLYDGKYWTYNSAEAFTKLFPFWNRQKVDRMLRHLEEDGWLLSGNYNENKYDRTKWYALSDKSINQKWYIHCPKLSNGKCQNEQPIPDSKPDKKHLSPTPYGLGVDTSAEISAEEGWEGEPPVAPRPPDGFAEFWLAYPRKDNKAKAIKAWARMMRTAGAPTVKEVCDHIRLRISSGAWKLSEKNFIPNPEAFINGRRWEDEVVPASINKKVLAVEVCTEPSDTEGVGEVYFMNTKYPDGTYKHRTVTRDEFRQKITSGEWVHIGRLSEVKPVKRV